MENEDNLIDNTLYDEEVTDWDTPKTFTKKEVPTELPPSNDSDHWEDGKVIHVDKRDLEKQTQQIYDKMKSHTKIIMQGREFICQSCPFTHTLNLDANVFTLDHSGNIIRLDSKQ